MEMARQDPERIIGMVLANTGHAGKGTGEREKRQAKVDLGNKDMRALADQWLPPMLAPGKETDQTLMDALIDMVLKAGPEVHERQITALLHRPDAGACLQKITCPILLLTGSEDGWSPVAQHREMQELAQNAVLQIVQGAGHFMPIEKPRETAEAVRNWIRDHFHA